MITLFYVFYISTEEVRLGTSKIPAILFYSAALILSFVFSYRLNDVFVIDMRFVPFLLGSLYHPLSPLLGLLTIIIRGFYGIDEGFFLNAIIFTVLSLFFWKWRPIFMKLKPYTKMAISFSLTTLYSIGILLLIRNWIPEEHALDIWFAQLTIPAISALILSYSIELITYNDQNERNVVKEERLKAIEQMGAAISHDIRNPLTAAIGFTELLSSQTTDRQSRQHYTTILKSEIEKAEQILQNYLTFSKPGKMTFSHVLVDDEIRMIIQMIQPLANYHSVKIVTQLNSGERIHVDRHKFQESLTALTRQAVLSIEKGGNLLISSSISGNRVSIRIEIQDVVILAQDYQEQSFGEQRTLLSAVHTVRAMKGTIENKRSPFGYSILLTFKRI